MISRFILKNFPFLVEVFIWASLIITILSTILSAAGSLDIGWLILSLIFNICIWFITISLISGLILIIIDIQEKLGEIAKK